MQVLSFTKEWIELADYYFLLFATICHFMSYGYLPMIYRYLTLYFYPLFFQGIQQMRNDVTNCYRAFA